MFHYLHGRARFFSSQPVPNQALRSHTVVWRDNFTWAFFGRSFDTKTFARSTFNNLARRTTGRRRASDTQTWEGVQRGRGSRRQGRNRGVKGRGTRTKRLTKVQRSTTLSRRLRNNGVKGGSALGTPRLDRDRKGPTRRSGFKPRTHRARPRTHRGRARTQRTRPSVFGGLPPPPSKLITVFGVSLNHRCGTAEPGGGTRAW